MIVECRFPPMYDEMVQVFDLNGKNKAAEPIFAWGNWIYNPHRVAIPSILLVHEAVHSRRQNGDPVGWWRKYLDDQQFRLEEEVFAHAAEYLHAASQAKDRSERRNLMHRTVVRLIDPLYAYTPRIPADRARGLIKRAIAAQGKTV